jgi:hypothetical protein
LGSEHPESPRRTERPGAPCVKRSLLKTQCVMYRGLDNISPQMTCCFLLLISWVRVRVQVEGYSAEQGPNRFGKIVVLAAMFALASPGL